MDDFVTAITASQHGIAIGYYVDCDTAVCADDAPAGFVSGDYSEWPGFEGWESPAAIFMDSESDSVTHCGTCGRVIRHDLTTEGSESITDSLGRYLDGGHLGAVAQWMEAYGDDVNIPGDYLSQFTQGYAHTMLWANTHGPGGQAADANGWLDGRDDEWAVSSFDSADQDSIREDCTAFIRATWADLGQLPRSYGARDDGSPSAGAVAGTAGHDFALTRNGHGAGYWSRGLGDLGDRLTKAAHSYGESSAWCYGEDDPESDHLAHLD